MKMNYFSKNRVRKIFIAVIALLFLAWGLSMMVDPIRRPRPMVRNYVLMLTPLGTDIDDVLEILENREGWGRIVVNRERGIVLPTAGDRSTAIGNQSIRVFAGNYWPSNFPIIGLIQWTTVSIFWGFDEDGKLIEVYVRKSLGW